MYATFEERFNCIYGINQKIFVLYSEHQHVSMTFYWNHVRSVPDVFAVILYYIFCFWRPIDFILSTAWIGAERNLQLYTFLPERNKKWQKDIQYGECEHIKCNKSEIIQVIEKDGSKAFTDNTHIYIVFNTNFYLIVFLGI